ncbi:hypothetical protein BH24ACT19_BH24ACT19_21460 [soil metagenome]
MDGSDCNDRHSVPVENAKKGEVSGGTILHLRGRSVRSGTLVGKVDADADLASLYQHLNTPGEFVTDRCRSTLEVIENGRYRRWTSEGYS